MTATEPARVRGSGPGRPVASGAGLRADIQGLRAVAVVAVIANHLFDRPTGAYVGVDVFFVISGFLITGLLLREHDRTGSVSWVGFYRRRVRRIVPAATAALAATVLAAAFLFPSGRLDATVRDAGYAFLFVSNWHFAAVGTDYFQQGLPPSPLQHFWSLAVEEQFYLVWPVLVMVVLGSALRSAAARRVVLGVVVGALALASFGWALVQTRDNPTVAYFSTLTRAWELALGALLALGTARVRRLPDRARWSLAWAGLALIVVACFRLTASSAVPAPAGLLPALGAVAVIAAGTGSGGYRGPWLLTNAVAGYLGRISYSLYLWHFPVIVLLATLMPPGAGYDLVVLVVTPALSAASFVLIEEPVRRSSWLEAGGRRTRPRTWLALGAALVLVVGLVSVREVRSRPVGITSATGVCVGAQAMDPARSCTVQTLPAATPSVGAAETDVGNAFVCWTDPDATAPHACRYGTGPLKVALVGDSHAAMLLPALMTGLGTHGWTLTTYLGWGCLWLTAGVGSSCDTEMTAIQSQLLTGPKYDLVITSAARQRLPAGADPGTLARAFAAEWKPVLARGTKVAVVADNPVYGPAAAQCVNRVRFAPADGCATPVADGFESPDPLIPAAALAPGASLIDLRSFYCTTTSCPAVIGNVLVYRDTVSHLTATFGRSLAPYLFAALGRAGG